MMRRTCGWVAPLLLVAALAPGTALAAASEPPDASEPSRAILGGSPAKIKRWPWQVGIANSPATTPGNAYRRQFCGGSLLAPTIVVTAAHCVYGRRAGFQPANEFTAITGRSRLTSPAGQEIPFEEIHVPVNDKGRPRYDDRTTRWDVVVVELASSSSSQTIQLAGPDERALWAPRRKVFVTGWGQLGEGGLFPDRLRATSTRIISDSSCRARYGAQFERETMVCAYRRGHDTCGGDSGGPLVAPMAGGGFRLIGDTSFGLGPCGAVPGVYGRLAAQPIQGFVRSTALQISGVDVVGSGARPPG